MTTLCYLFIYIFEQFIAYMYFKNKFHPKRKAIIIGLCYVLSFLTQYAIQLFDNPFLNLASFFVANIIIVAICFEASIRQIIFNTLLLEGIMITTEIVVMYLFSSILNIDLLACKNSNFIIFLETATTKAFYFFVASLISKISKKESHNIYSKNDYSFLLFILPAVSILIIASFAYLSFILPIDKTTNILFSVASIVLLLSNVIVLIVHEKIIDTIMKNAELQLEMQKTEINDEYYRELEQQYNSSSLLIHDIKKCLMNIRELSVQKENDHIITYIDSIYNGYEIKSFKQFSNHKLVNIIVSRYEQLCESENIRFSVDIRSVDFSFMSDSDITALLDNLLENAYEAAKASEIGIIDLSIEKQNERYVRIQTSNSSEQKPIITNGIIKSTKSNNKLHGIGIKSITKITKKYSGNIAWNYDDASKVFTSTILLKMDKH